MQTGRTEQAVPDLCANVRNRLIAGVAGQARQPGIRFPAISAVSRQGVFTFMQQFGSGLRFLDSSFLLIKVT